MLSQKAKYAIKALIALAKSEGRLLQANEIAQAHNIPKKFLDLIFFELRGHGLIHSTRGREGGYSLAMPADQITIARVVRAVDGPIAMLPCASVAFYRKCADCDEKSCEVRRIMREVRDAASLILDNTTLAEAASKSGRKRAPAKASAAKPRQRA